MKNPQKCRRSGPKVSAPAPRTICVALLAALALPVQADDVPMHLSDWLTQHPMSADDYPLGLSWRVPAEVPKQQALRARLLRDLDALRDNPQFDPALRRTLREWLAAQPVTGRVPVAVADARWLQANPNRDPELAAGHTVVLPTRPATVTVLGATAQPCQVAHARQRRVVDYVHACAPEAAVDWVWLVQPDGKVQRFGVASWNLTAQGEAAPGAWIWAPGRDPVWPESFSARLTEFLATQGPAPDLAAATAVRVAPQADAPSPASAQEMRLTSNDWGGAGLLQTPSARMRPEGELTVNVTRDYPYTQFNVSLQPFDWLETIYRYSGISNRIYGPGLGLAFSNGQSYKDKSIDAKFRLMQESAWLPALAVGFRDMVGTGLFSGEYLVASKRTGDFDWNLGLGWGYLGSRGSFSNPLGLLSQGMNARPVVAAAQGGTFSLNSYFRGRTAVFGGVQYQTPWAPLLLKLEYDGNNYQNEPLGNVFKVRSPFNVGAVYQVSKEFDVSIGIERGNTAMLGLTLHEPLSRTSQPKLADPPRPPVATTRPLLVPNWEAVRTYLAEQTSWKIGQIEQQGRELRVTLDDAEAGYWRQRLDRAVAVLHQAAPAEVDNFTFVYRNRGLTLAEHQVNRDAWVAQQTQALPPSARLAPVMTHAPQSSSRATGLYQQAPARFENTVDIGLDSSMGGPNSFLLYQLFAHDQSKLRLGDSTWLQSDVRLGLFDNYNQFTFTAPATGLPRVRTFVREFVTSAKLTLPNLQATHVGQIGENSFYSLYGGLLEYMYAGVGGEWLYRPYESSLAIGVDVNSVQMRGFKQDFSLQNYKTTTGHVSLYWDTGWRGVQANVSAGRYLAKDIGVSLQLTRHFENGVTMGAGVTKTNVNAVLFGEGSFDKWIRFTIPFDALLTHSATGDVSFTWQPLLRDGGAKLHRAVELYDLTRIRDARTLGMTPAPLSNDLLPVEEQQAAWLPPAKGIEPYLETPQVVSYNQWQASAQPAWRLQEALYRQQFRDIEVVMEPTGRLNVRASNAQIRPLSRAAGRAVRAALRNAPPEARSIRITLLAPASLRQLESVPVVEYEFTDLDYLRQYFDGYRSESSLANTVKVRYLVDSLRESEPLALLGDTTPIYPAALPLPQVAEPVLKPVYRVRDDLVNGYQHAQQIDWLSTAVIGGGMVLASSLLDKAGDRYAQRNAQNAGLKAVNRIGNTLVPLVFGTGAIAAVFSEDPLLSRAGYAAMEAGGTALALTLGSKFVFGRARPMAGQGSASFHPFAGSANALTDGFPSGHAMLVWAVATPFAEAYRQPLFYSLATLTNIARVGSRNHWISDTVAGSVLGYGIGKILWESSRNGTGKYPSIGLTGRELTLTWDMP